MSQKTHFHFQLGSGPLILHFLKVLVFEKAHFLFKLIFKATVLQMISEYAIFLKTVLFTLVSRTNWGLNAAPVGLQHIFKQLKSEMKNFRLSEEIHFHFYFGSDPWILYFLEILVFGKPWLLRKSISQATLLEKIPEYNIFKKTLFCPIASSINFGLNAVPVAPGECL